MDYRYTRVLHGSSNAFCVVKQWVKLHATFAQACGVAGPKSQPWPFILKWYL